MRILASFLLLATITSAWAKDAATPEEAVAQMTLGEGFSATVFAAEPDLEQPFAFCFDDRGRVWVLENRNYQDRQSGYKEGDSRILILEDTDGDGRFDTRKVFHEGIVFPTGIELGFGGVWVGSPPNLLFIPDRDHDDVPDGEPEIVLDGWGINDQHETLNSFNWGPDGWLYGCHGIFTQSYVGPPKEGGKMIKAGDPFPVPQMEEGRVPINGGIWRYHPVKKKFEVFAWGGSNQWGIDYDENGRFFMSACVIPHLWHVIQGGRYHRQAGRHYNPYVYDDIKTITDHPHPSAHGGARIYLADAFPPEYRGRLFMCNIHTHCVYTDILEGKGSGFIGHHGDDFMLSNDNHFIGFNLEVGPEGALYLIDWNDADICGNAVYAGSTGRLYRIAYEGTKPAVGLKLAAMSDAELVDLHAKATNDWYVRHARRLLQERAVEGKLEAQTHDLLRALFETTAEIPRKLRALWALHVTGGLTPGDLVAMLDHENEHVRGWAIQLLCEDENPPAEAIAKCATLAKDDPSPIVRLYLASALQRIPVDQRWDIAAGLVTHEQDKDDHNLPLMDWYGIEPLVPTDKTRALKLAATTKIPVIRQYIARRMSEKSEEAPLEQSEQDFGELIGKVAEGFTTDAVGEGGVEFIQGHMGRDAVRTHPVDPNSPCVLSRQVEIPEGKKARLEVSASHHPHGDWLLVIHAGDKTLHESTVGNDTAKDGWHDITVDLTEFAGQSIDLRVENKASDWTNEWAYWGRIALVID